MKDEGSFFFLSKTRNEQTLFSALKNSQLQLAFKTDGTVTTASNPPSQEVQYKAKVSGKATQLNGNMSFGQEFSWRIE